jgi:hypothetical protein
VNGPDPIDPIVLVTTVPALGAVGFWLARGHLGSRTEGRNHVRLMNAVINPLSFLDLDVPGQPEAGDRPTAASVLGFLCPGEGGADLSLLSKRYNEISPEPVRCGQQVRATRSRASSESSVVIRPHRFGGRGRFNTIRETRRGYLERKGVYQPRENPTV